LLYSTCPVTQSPASDIRKRTHDPNARAAMIYQHATEEADQAIADALDNRIENSRKTADDGTDDDYGTAGALAKVG
jgi:hypothetical protein